MIKTDFWREKTLSSMTPQEWEALCDGCGLCCLHKLEDIDSGAIASTNVACRLLDPASCRCRNYPGRKKLVADCIILTPDMVAEFHWLPKTCAYRLIYEGKDLEPWHPLISGSRDSVHTAGISVRNRVISEQDAGCLEDHIVTWDNFPASQKDGTE